MKIFLVILLTVLICFSACTTPSSSEQLVDIKTPYANMSREEMRTMFENNEVIDAPTVKNAVFNTPYYYIIKDSDDNGGKAYSKITNTFTNLCRDVFCDHENCIFSGTIVEVHVYGNRIYFLFEEREGLIPTYKYNLYSTDYDLDDLKLEYAFETVIATQYEENKTDSGTQVEVTFVDTIENLCFYDDIVYYNDYVLDDEDNIICTIYRLNLNEKESQILFDNKPEASALKLKDSVLQWKDEDGNWLYFDLKTNNYVSNNDRINDEIVLSDGYKLMTRLVCHEYTYITIDHTTSHFREDQYYEYYCPPIVGITTRDVFKRAGGEIFRIKTDGSDGGRPDLIAELSTNGIPDVIYWCYTDGKTIIVKYETYRDFDNIYNMELDAIEIGLGAYKYAIIDIESGAVYKPEE